MSSSTPRNSHYEEESFIILGSTSPKTSMESAMIESKILQSSKGSDLFKLTNTPPAHVKSSSSLLEDEIMTFKAHFSLEQPSPASVEMASAVIMECSDTTDVQAKIVELLEENSILRKTLKQNNFSMREQFKSIIDWQDDMMKTHQLHKSKFFETRELVEKLRLDNSKLRKELDALKNDKLLTSQNNVIWTRPSANGLKESQTSPTSNNSDRIVEILTSELETVERQRKQVIEDNEKLLADKEKLLADKESIEREFKLVQQQNVDMKKINDTAQELESANTQLKKELEVLKLEKSTLVNSIDTRTSEINSPEESFIMTAANKLNNSDLENTIDVLTSQLELIERQRRQVINENEKLIADKEHFENDLSLLKTQNLDLISKMKNMEEEMCNTKDNDTIRSLEAKVSNLQIELKNSHVKLLQSENTKLEFTQHRLESQENIKQLTSSIAELKERLREAHTITFQPVRYSLSLEAQCDSSEFANFVENVKLYDKTLKDLSGYLNQHAQEFCTLFDSVTSMLMEIQTIKVDNDCCQVKIKLSGIKDNLDKHHSVISNYNHLVKSALATLEKMFLDYQQVLRILKNEESLSEEHSQLKKHTDALTARLLHRDEQVEAFQKEIKDLKDIVITFQKDSDERDLLRAQLDIYKTDFEAERDSRTQIASEKEEILANLKALHRRNQELSEEVNGFRSRYPHNFGNMTFTSSGTPPSSSSSGPRPSVNTLNHEVSNWEWIDDTTPINTWIPNTLKKST